MSNNELDLYFSFKTKNNLNSEFKKTEKQAEKTSKKMVGSFNNAFRAIASGFAVNMFKTQIVSAEKLNFGLSIIETKNKDLATAMQATERASYGLASKFDMVDAVNRAMAFGIDLSKGKYQELVKVATKVSMVMGTDVKSAFNDIIVASARQSKLIADNLGVVISVTDANRIYAQKLGITAKQLTANQKKTAFLSEMLRQMKGSIKGVSDQMVKSGTKTQQTLNKIHATYQKIAAIIASLTGDSINFIEGAAKGVAIQQEERAEMYKNLALEEIANLKLREKAHKIYMSQAKERKESVFEEYRAREAEAEIFDVLKSQIAAKKEINLWNKRNNFEMDKLRNAERQQLLGAEEAEQNYNPFGKIKNFDAPKIKTDAKKVGRKLKKEIVKEMVFTEKDADKILNDAFFARLRNTKLDIPDGYKGEKSGISKVGDFLGGTDEEIQQKIAERNAKRQQEERDRTMMHYRALEGFGRGFYAALISDQENAIPLYLANQAMMFGQTLFWDGVKTMWMGTAENAILPGAGLSAMAVGAMEMGIGAGLMAGGAVASKSLSTSSSKNSSGATERATEREVNINVTAKTSLYATKKEASKEITKLVKNGER